MWYAIIVTYAQTMCWDVAFETKDYELAKTVQANLRKRYGKNAFVEIEERNEQ